MTREQARQIEASALRRLRRPSGPCAKRVIDSFAEVRDSDEGIRRDGSRDRRRGTLTVRERAVFSGEGFAYPPGMWYTAEKSTEMRRSYGPIQDHPGKGKRFRR